MSSTERHIYTVSELTASLKHLLEDKFPFVWISGEISNFRKPSSGHFYFTLKDPSAQISAVMFRNQNRKIGFKLEDGQHLIGLGRISVYEPRGSYQLILEYLEPKGVGALQMAFEQLKNKLSAEGLFDPAHKKPIPFLPGQLSVITSASGAVVHDILNVVNRRYPNMPVDIIPVRVQGDGAAAQIVAAIETFNRQPDCEVMIIARGGGSLEDLQAFNSEDVARAIFASHVPVISAIGHDTDFTISDFVADLRAPTPSAAAELAVPVKEELKSSVDYLYNRLCQNMKDRINRERHSLSQVVKYLPHPRKKVQDLMFRIDDHAARIVQAIFRQLRYHRQDVTASLGRLIDHSPAFLAYKLNVKLDKLNYNISRYIDISLTRNKHKVRECATALAALNPRTILKRGYSITHSLPDYAVVKSPEDVTLSQSVEITVASGKLICRVERTYKDGEKIL